MKWEEKRIGDLVSLQRGHDLTAEERSEGDVPVIGSAGQNGYHNVARASGPGVTIGRSGGSVGVVTYVPEDYWPHNTCIYVTDFRGNDPKFVAMLLGRLDLASLNSGAAQPSLNRNFIYPLRINVPSVQIQTRIAAILTAYDDLIENNRRRMALLEESARLLYREWFVHLRFPGHATARVSDGIPKGWRKVGLGEVAAVNRENLKKGFEGEIEYIDIATVSPGEIGETCVVDFDESPSRARRVVRHGDIIWSCVRPNRRSHAVIWNPAENLIASTGFAVLSPKAVPTTFLYGAVTTDDFVGYLENHARGAAYPAVVASDFERAEILVPAPEVLGDFDAVVSTIFDQLHVLRAQTQKLKTARDLLLPKLMSGDIEV